MAVKISKNIVGFSIKKKDEPIVQAAPTRETMHEEVQRPDELKGYTYKIKTPLSDHAMYITVNNMVLTICTEHEHEVPCKSLLNSKNMTQVHPKLTPDASQTSRTDPKLTTN